MWEFVDKVVYINLKFRPDRNEHMKQFTNVFGDKVYRFNAIEDTPGYLGCSQSHIGVLKLAMFHGWENVLVLEDDAEWNQLELNYKRLEKLTARPYDVILLGGVCIQKDSNDKVFSSQTASAYLVSKHYYPRLLQNFEEGYHQLKYTNNHQIFALDQHWKQLQKVDTWYVVSNPCMVYQKPDYSDIEKKYVDYRDAFQL